MLHKLSPLLFWSTSLVLALASNDVIVGAEVKKLGFVLLDLTSSSMTFRGNASVQDPRDGFGDYHSSSPERSQQRSQQP